MELADLLHMPLFPVDQPTHKPPRTPEELSFPHVIDNSTLTHFKLCHRRHYWATLRLAQSRESNVHLIAGGAYARGLEVVRREYFDNGLSFPEALKKGVRAAIIFYGRFEPYGKGSVKTIWRIIGAMEYHFSVWPIDSLLRPYRPHADARHTIEYSFAQPIDIAHPVTGDPLLYAGKFDFAGQHLETGAIGPVDDKTTTQLGDYWRNQWDLSGQMHGYGWAMTRDGIHPTAAFIRGVAILKGRYNHEDAYVLMSPNRIDDWYSSTCDIIANAVTAWKNKKWPKDFSTACSMYGGCAYKGICQSETPEVYVPIEFQLNEWDPLNSRE